MQRTTPGDTFVGELDGTTTPRVNVLQHCALLAPNDDFAEHARRVVEQAGY